jgi:hypothetical protein
MSITIAKVGDRYTGEVTPPHGGGVPWRSPEPLDAEVLVRELLSRGCHQTDIGDALYAADPNWTEDPEQFRGRS